MKKLLTVAVVLGLSLPVLGQEVPLFDDDVPNLGRDAKPQDEIVLTPSQLPEVRVHLDNSAKPTEKKQQAKPIVEQPKPAPTPVTGRTIDLGGRLSQQQADEMSRQLDDEIQRYQEAKAREELERATKEAEQKRLAEQAAAAREKKNAKAQMPDSMADLFGKMHDVYEFDISGFELGMTPDEATEMAEERGYAILRVEHGIPLHRTSFYEHNCRGTGIYRPQDIQACIIEQAQADDVYYVSSMTLARPSSAEKIQLLFSTLATDNVIYKIYYENEGDNSLNFTQRNLVKKLNRRDAFWRLVYETYGSPDDRENMIWGDQQTAYLQAAMQGSNYNAYLIMEDRTISDADYIDATEQREDLHYKYPFTFAISEEDED